MSRIIPCMKFNTTYIIVDDNPKFLTNFTLALGNDILYKSFSLPLEAVEFIKKQEINLRDFIKKYFHIAPDEAEPNVTRYDINSFKKVLYDKNRFLLSAVAITDYAMNDMTGAELCKAIVDRYMKIIMLTGEAGYDIAVSSFNQKEIDQFVLKDDPEYYQKIQTVADQLEDELFQDISKPILTAINNKDNLFSDKNFIKFFDKFVKDYDIVEYYLLEPCGSYIMLNSKGKAILLIGKDEEEMRVLYELASDHTKAPPMIAEYFRKKEKMTYFPPESKYYTQGTSPEYWPLIDVNKIELENNNFYYYGIVNELERYYNFDQEKIISYHDFKNS